MAPSVPPGESVVHELWAHGTDPARGADDPTLELTEAEFATPAGQTRWILTEMGPYLQVARHHTPTTDYAVLVAGEVELGLDTGRVLLHASDTVLVDGVEHSWHAGPEGCVIATVLVGLREADR